MAHNDGQTGRRRERRERLPVDVLGQDRPEDGLMVWRWTQERSVKPSAQPTLVRTQHLPHPGETARWLRKRGPAGRFLLVTPCIRVCHCGSMHGSAHVHMVY